MGRPDQALSQQVVRRAGGRCEYCLLPEATAATRFQIDHIIAEKHKGPTTLENLAWVCLSCNVFKGPNVAGVDAVTSEVVRLFHPRKDVWAGHFEWQGAWLRGRTSIGRVTIAVLEINHPDAVAVRESLAEEGML